MSQLQKLIEEMLALDPDAPELEFEGNWRSWGRLEADARALDALLTREGFGAATRVGVVLRNKPEIVATIIGLFLSERCLASFNANSPDERLAGDVGIVRVPVLIATAADWKREPLRRAAKEAGSLCVSLSDDAAAPVSIIDGTARRLSGVLHIEAPGIAIEMLSSGTTGAPKRIPLPAANLEKALLSAAAFEKNRSDTAGPRLRGGVQIVTAPFAHIAGITAVMNNILAGRKICLLEKFSVESFCWAVRRHRPKVAGAPPAAIRMILDANVAPEDLSSLLAFRTGTAPLDPELADEFIDRYGIPVLQNYGATEFAGGAAGWTLDDFRDHWKSKRGSVGRLNRGTNARTVNTETGEVLEVGAAGLLEIQAPNIGDGKSWVRTTDLARIDGDRFLWILGRHDSAIIRGGFKIHPEDVARAIERHPSVREAAVVALPDPRLGQIPGAAYILRSGAEDPGADGLREFLRGQLLPYQVPPVYLRLEELPRTPSLKTNQVALRALFEASSAALAG
jgi:long-chain acyl-CoA synthetase